MPRARVTIAGLYFLLLLGAPPTFASDRSPSHHEPIEGSSSSPRCQICRCSPEDRQLCWIGGGICLGLGAGGALNFYLFSAGLLPYMGHAAEAFVMAIEFAAGFVGAGAGCGGDKITKSSCGGYLFCCPPPQVGMH